MKTRTFSRRQFIAVTGAALSVPLLIVVDAKWIEPGWLKVRRLRIGNGKPTHRLVHFTDLHYKGDCEFLLSIVNKINSLSPDFVCFTGDLVDAARHLEEALFFLSEIKSPLFGVPGNHDYWSRVSFEPIQQCFNATGGAWLLDEQRLSADGRVNIIGATCSHASQALLPLYPKLKNILLIHYPAWANKLGGQKFDLLLAGHSHGGQVRVPFFGPFMVPFRVGEYDMGLFQTPAGPLYVNPGIGWFYVNWRFNCRPEITLIEI
jgi:predicted MPP superfamily phosphohydrolase